MQKMTTLPIIAGFSDYVEKKLSQFPKYAICTGSTTAEILPCLKKLNISTFFENLTTLVTADDVRHGKPSPEGYLLAAKQLEVDPANCLVIEDSPYGIAAAKASGMDVIALTTTEKNIKNLKQADKIVNDFNDLL